MTTSNINMSRLEHQTCTNLSKNQNLIIKSADKGGGVVLLDKSDYLIEAYNILSEKEFYLPLVWDPSAMFLNPITI